MKEKQHSVPQNIMSVEFKIIGDMSMKQFAFIAVPACIGFIMFITHVSNYITIPLTGIFLLLGVLGAFIPIDDRPLDQWITNFLITIKKPTQRIWMREPSGISSVFDIPQPPTISSSNKEIATFLYQNPFDTAIKNNMSNVDGALELKESILNANIDKINKLLTTEKIDTNLTSSTSPLSSVLSDNPVPYPPSVTQQNTQENNNIDSSVDENSGSDVGINNEGTSNANLNEPISSDSHNSSEDVVYGTGTSSYVSNASSSGAQTISSDSANVSPSPTFTQQGGQSTVTDSNKNNDGSVGANSVVTPPTSNIHSNNFVNEQNVNASQSSLDNSASSMNSDLSKIIDRINQLEIENSKLKNEIFSRKEQNNTLQSNIEQVKTKISSQQGTFDQQSLISKLPDFVKTPNVISGVIVNSDGTLISDAVVIIKDSNQKPIRAVKSNQLGQFYTRTALLNGVYNIEINAQGYKFNSVGIELTGSVVIPFIFIPVMQENSNL
jgi:hypothetical protein